jgi:2EXR family
MPLPPEAFSIFHRLPPEIRCQIWRTSTPNYRLVPIEYRMSTCSYVPRTSPPAILQVNRESRREGLSIYHELRIGPVPAKHCYVDLTRDVVYLKSYLHDQLRYDKVAIADENGMGNRGRLVSPPPRHRSAALPALVPPSRAFGDPDDGNELITLRHSKIILYDLLTGTDGEAMLRNLHVNASTWSSIRRYYRYYRHRLPFHVQRVILVYERGTGPLSEDIRLKPIQWQYQDSEEENLPQNYNEDRIATRMSRSFRAESMMINRRDQQAGLPRVLNFTVEPKSLDRDDKVADTT